MILKHVWTCSNLFRFNMIRIDTILKHVKPWNQNMMKYSNIWANGTGIVEYTKTYLEVLESLIQINTILQSCWNLTQFNSMILQSCPDTSRLNIMIGFDTILQTCPDLSWCNLIQSYHFLSILKLTCKHV